MDRSCRLTYVRWPGPAQACTPRSEKLPLQARWKVHPDRIVTHRFKLAEAGEAYRLAAEGLCGKVVILPNAP